MYLKLKMKRILPFITLITFPTLFFGQIKISENIQKSLIASSDENALYFIDFWATWCGPCVHASNYLTSLQQKYPDNFYVMSLSQENPNIVKGFIKKHNLQLAVAIDYNGESFSKYNITSLPYGILFDANGKKLWEGHPAEFKSYHINGYLTTHKKKVKATDMFPLYDYEPVAVVKEDDFKGDFEIEALEHPMASLIIDKKSKYLELSGSLTHILAYTNHVFTDQIKMAPEIENYYRVKVKYQTSGFDTITKEILKHLKLSQHHSKTNGEVLYFDIDDSRFWDINQIDWGTDTPNFLIGDSDIKADNVSLNEVNYQLANLLKTPIVTSNQSIAEEIHDWDIHYKYFELMSSGLKDTYGIKVEKRYNDYPEYIITKKAP
ncbi:hypothetical protein MHTCC0001_33590 [Flavobacteriaceae bacterium MHTCC 0001]